MLYAASMMFQEVRCWTCLSLNCPQVCYCAHLFLPAGLWGLDGVQSLWNLQTSQSASLPRLPEVYTPHGPPLSLVRSHQPPFPLFITSQTLLVLFVHPHLLNLQRSNLCVSVCRNRINNCVGELNQKYFIQFLFYTGECIYTHLTLVKIPFLSL